MPRLTRAEFEQRFLLGDVDLTPNEVEQEDSSWVLELDSMPYERTALKLKEIVAREEGGRPLYLQVGSTMVKLGDVEPSVVLINELEQTLHMLGVRLTEEGEPVVRMNYLGGAKLPSLSESDYLV